MRSPTSKGVAPAAQGDRFRGCTAVLAGEELLLLRRGCLEELSPTGVWRGQTPGDLRELRAQGRVPRRAQGSAAA